MLSLQQEKTAILIIDMQERLVSAMPPSDVAQSVRAATILLGTAEALGLPVFFTEQYPKGLGSTVEPLLSQLSRLGAQRFEKTCFSVCGVVELLSALQGAQLETVLVLGMEAHVCVFQSVRDLVVAGFSVHLVIDGVVSRAAEARQVGIRLSERAGAMATCAEAVLFDLLGDSSHPSFRTLSRLVR